MNFIKLGSGKHFIVFLHGWGGCIDSFFWTKSYFEDFSLVYLDFYGFGNSPEPDKPLYVSDYAVELKNILNKFEIQSLTIVGHSFGGRVAIKFAFLYQHNYKDLKLFLIDSAGIKPQRSPLYYLKVYNYKRLKNKAKKSPRLKQRLKNFGSDDYKKLSDIMKKTFINIVNEDLAVDAKFITASTIIMWGKKDTETKLYMAKKLHKLINNSKLFIFKNAGHFSYIDQRQEFLILLDRFVRNK